MLMLQPRRRQPRPSERPPPQPTALKVMELWKNARLWLPTALQKQNRAWALFIPCCLITASLTQVYAGWINGHFSIDIGKRVPTKLLPEPGNLNRIRSTFHIQLCWCYSAPNFRLNKKLKLTSLLTNWIKRLWKNARLWLPVPLNKNKIELELNVHPLLSYYCFANSCWVE